MTSFEDLASRVDAQLSAHRRELEELIRIPSVSADSFDQSQLTRSAEAVAELARARGLDAEVIQLLADGQKKPRLLRGSSLGTRTF